MKLIWGDPPRRPVIFFSGSFRAAFNRWAAPPEGVTFLDRDDRPIYLGLRVLFRFLWNLPKCFHPELRQGGWRYRVYAVYLLAAAEAIGPKGILTFTDNHEIFHWLAGQMNGIRFLAVQNGLRNPLELAGTLTPSHPRTVKMRLPEYICFGRAEEEAFPAFGHEVGRFVRLGSPMGGEYLKVREKNPPTEYDLCLISQWDPSHMCPTPMWPDFKKGFSELCQLFGRLVAERPELRACVALRTAEPEERRFFETALGRGVELIEGKRMEFSSYRAIDRSRLTICLNSTLGHEAFGLGCPVLFCNYTGSPGFSVRRKGIWTLEEPGYVRFRDRVDALLAKGPEEYREASREAARYLMEYQAGRSVLDAVRDWCQEVLSLSPQMAEGN